MGEFIIDATDHEAVKEVITGAYRLLQPIRLLGLARPHTKTPTTIVRSGICKEASDVVTRAAQDLGIVASRELHPYQGHHLTSFAPLDQLPSADDPILCLTPGQFNQEAFNNSWTHFFGLRGDLAACVGDCYDEAYGATSTILRQVTHTPHSLPDRPHRWLNTSPADITTLAYPVGEVDEAAFLAMQHRLPGLSQNLASC